MIRLLQQGEWAYFALILVVLVISLSYRQYVQAWTAKRFGDDTGERAGRLTINPLVHIDFVGLLILVVAGVGWFKPVPTDSRLFTSRYGDLLVAAAGPGMNLLLAIVTINLYAMGLKIGWDAFQGTGPYLVFYYLTLINLVLMLINLLPIGELDGHRILPYFLPRRLAVLYRYYNHRYGRWLLLLLVLLVVFALPAGQTILGIIHGIMPLIVFVPL
jgi:Zn-dependent protease